MKLMSSPFQFLKGTFSSVYKAIDCQHAFYDNSKWSNKRLPFNLRRAVETCIKEEQQSAHNISSKINTRSKSHVTAAVAAAAAAGHRKGHKRTASKMSEPYGKLVAARKLLKQGLADALAEEGSRSKVYVALKRIYVTSSPNRIFNELDILADLRDARHTAYLIAAIRHEDQVIAVMPYEKHQDFRVGHGYSRLKARGGCSMGSD